MQITPNYDELRYIGNNHFNIWHLSFNMLGTIYVITRNNLKENQTGALSRYRR